MINPLEYHAPRRSASTLAVRPLVKWFYAIAGIVALGCGVFLAGVHLKTGRAQERTYQRLLAHAPTVKAAVAVDPRFSKVTVDALKGKHGVALWVGGTVSTWRDRDALEKIISATQPPGRVHYTVDVDPRR